MRGHSRDKKNIVLTIYSKDYVSDFYNKQDCLLLDPHFDTIVKLETSKLSCTTSEKSCTPNVKHVFTPAIAVSTHCFVMSAYYK